MQEPVHSIHVDRDRLLVDMRVSGFLSPEDAGWLGEEVRAAILSLGAGVGRHVTLYDVTGLDVAPGATIETIKAMFAHPEVRALWARKVAIVTGSVLGRMQMQRLRAARADVMVFSDREAALAWLLEDQVART